MSTGPKSESRSETARSQEDDGFPAGLLGELVQECIGDDGSEKCIVCGSHHDLSHVTHDGDTSCVVSKILVAHRAGAGRPTATALHYACVNCAASIASTGMCETCSHAYGIGRGEALEDALRSVRRGGVDEHGLLMTAEDKILALRCTPATPRRERARPLTADLDKRYRDGRRDAFEDIVEWIRGYADQPHTIEAGEKLFSPATRGVLLMVAEHFDKKRADCASDLMPVPATPDDVNSRLAAAAPIDTQTGERMAHLGNRGPMSEDLAKALTAPCDPTGKENAEAINAAVAEAVGDVLGQPVQIVSGPFGTSTIEPAETDSSSALPDCECTDGTAPDEPADRGFVCEHEADRQRAQWLLGAINRVPKGVEPFEGDTLTLAEAFAEVRAEAAETARAECIEVAQAYAAQLGENVSLLDQQGRTRDASELAERALGVKQAIHLMRLRAAKATAPKGERT